LFYKKGGISMKTCMFFAAAALAALGFAGCSENPSAERPAASSPDAAKAEFLLASEPAGAKGVAEFRRTAADDEQVVVVGRVGGDTNPWVEGAAAFLITDMSLKPCSEREGDNCPTPWDYCCDLGVLKDSKEMVKVVDEQGDLVRTDAKELLGVKELDTVVVRGRTQKDDAGNVTVLAEGVFKRT